MSDSVRVIGWPFAGPALLRRLTAECPALPKQSNLTRHAFRAGLVRAIRELRDVRNAQPGAAK